MMFAYLLRRLYDKTNLPGSGFFISMWLGLISLEVVKVHSELLPACV